MHLRQNFSHPILNLISLKYYLYSQIQLLENQVYMKPLIIYLCLAFFFISCKNQTNTKEQKQTDIKKKTASENSSLKHYDFENPNPDIKLPDVLSEISGICFNDKGQMFAHGDEDADIFEIDYKTGTVISMFYVGDPSSGKEKAMNGDFEDITFVGTNLYLVKNNGTIYEFSEGKKGEVKDFREYKTKLTSQNDVEGLCYDVNTNSLLLLCKGYAGEGYDKQKAVYSFDLKTLTLNEKPRFLISLEKDFAPSGIAANTKTGTFYIIAAQGNLILEISKDGEILDEKKLPKKFHEQPEGIAIGKDMTLYISNEGKDGSAKIISYPYIP